MFNPIYQKNEQNNTTFNFILKLNVKYPQERQGDYGTTSHITDNNNNI